MSETRNNISYRLNRHNNFSKGKLFPAISQFFMHPPPAIVPRSRSNARPRCILPPPGYKYRGLTELLHLMRLDRKGKRKMIMCQLHWRVIRGGGGRDHNDRGEEGERRRGASGREEGPVSKLKPETKQTDEQWGSKAKVIKYDKRHEQRTCLFVGDPRSRAPLPLSSTPRSLRRANSNARRPQQGRQLNFFCKLCLSRRKLGGLYRCRANNTTKGLTRDRIESACRSRHDCYREATSVEVYNAKIVEINFA